MPGKRLNKNVIVVVTLMSFATIILLSVVMLRKLQQRDPKYFIEHATRHREAGDFRQAALFYNKAWDRSNDAAYLVSQGEMLLADGEVQLAVRAWQGALVHQPDLVAAHRANLEVLLELAQLEQREAGWRLVGDAASKMLEASKALAPVDEAFARHARGLASIQFSVDDSVERHQGLDDLRRAVDLAPDVADYSIDLALMLVQSDRVEEGERLFEELLGRHKSPGLSAVKVRRAYAGYLAGFRKRDLESAERTLREGIDLAGSDGRVDAQLAYGVFLTQQWARKVRAEAPESQTKEIFAAAEKTLQDCVSADPLAFEASLQLARLYTAAGRDADAYRVCEDRLGREFSRKGITAAKNKILRFNLLMLASQAAVAQANAAESGQRDQWFDRAEKHVQDAFGDFAAHPQAHSQWGRVLLARGREREGLDELRKADEIYNNFGAVDWQHKMVLATLHLKLNEPGAAKAVLDPLLRQAQAQRPDDIDFWLLYGQVEFLNDELDRAFAFAERILQIDPENKNAQKLKAAVYERKGRLSDAVAAYPQAQETEDVKPLLEFLALARDGAYDEALRVLLSAVERDPSNSRLVWTAAGELMKLDRAGEARAVVQRAREEQPEDVTLQKLAALVNAELSPEARDRELLGIIEAETDGYQRSLELADFHIQHANAAEGLKLLTQAEQHLIQKDTPLARQATVVQHRELLNVKLRLAYETKDNSAMKEAVDSAARHNVDGAGGKSLLGLFHALRNETELAVAAFQEAVESQPTDARTLALLGHCLYNLGRFDDAATYFERSARIRPTEWLAYRGLAAVSRVRGDDESFAAAFEKAKLLAPDDPWIQAETEAAQERADPPNAIARREKQLLDKPNDLDNLRRLAALSEQVGDRDRADRYHNLLLEQAPNDETVVSAAARYFRKSDRSERALEVLSQYVASRATPAERTDATVLLAGHYLSQNDPKHAEAVLKDAMSRSETLNGARALAEICVRRLNRPREAVQYLDRAVALAEQSKSPQLPQVLDARIAALLHRQVNDTQTARGYVDELRRSYPNDPRGLYWDSELHARSGDLEKAVATLTEYLQRSPNDSAVLFQRAQHYLALGRSSQAMADLEQIKRTDPFALDMQPRLVLSRLHARAGRELFALQELESIVQDAPTDAEAAEELIRTYIRGRRFPDAERLVSARLQRAVGESAARWYYLRGEAAFEAGDANQAVEAFRQGALAEGNTLEAMWKVLTAYYRAGRYKEGLEYYAERATNVEPTGALLARQALLLARADRRNDAIVAFRRAMSLAVSESVDAIRAVTDDLRSAMSTADGIALCEQTPVLPEDVRGNERILIRLYRLAGRTDEAAEKIDRALASAVQDTERAGLWYERGEMDQLRGNWNEARQAYEESLKYDPDNWVTLNNLAYLLSDGLGQHAVAVDYAKKATAVNDSPEVLDTLGWIYVGLGDYTSAVAVLSRAVRGDPDGAALLFHLAEAYRRNAQFLEAADVLNRALPAAEAAGNKSLSDRIRQAQKQVESRDRNS